MSFCCNVSPLQSSPACLVLQESRHQPENLEIALQRLQQLLEAAADEVRPPPPLTAEEDFEIEKRRAVAEYRIEKRLESKKLQKTKREKRAA